MQEDKTAGNRAMKVARHRRQNDKHAEKDAFRIILDCFYQ